MCSKYIAGFSLVLFALLFLSNCNNNFSSRVPLSSLANCNMYRDYSDPESSRYMTSLSFKNDESQLPEVSNISPYTLNGYAIRPYTFANALSDYVPNLPATGKWMMVSFSQHSLPVPAAWVYWLGIGFPSPYTERYMQPTQHVLEAINFLILVKAANESAATYSFITAVTQAGFSDAQSAYHTGGYGVYFNGQYVHQLAGYPQCSEPLEPCSTGHMPLTFAKGLYTTADSHFRALGPYQVNSQYYIYAASLSQESPYYNELRCGHMYVSFLYARNELAIGLINEGIHVYSARLNNTIAVPTDNIPGNQVFYTGDFQRGESNDLTFIAVVN